MYDELSDETKNLIKKYDEYKTHVDGFNDIKNELERDEELYDTIMEDDEDTDIEQEIGYYKFDLEYIREDTVRKNLESEKKSLIEKMKASNKNIDYDSLNTNLKVRIKRIKREISDKVRQMDNIIKYLMK